VLAGGGSLDELGICPYTQHIVLVVVLAVSFGCRCFDIWGCQPFALTL